MIDAELQQVIDHIRDERPTVRVGGNSRLPLSADGPTRIVTSGEFNLFAFPVDDQGQHVRQAIFICTYGPGDLIPVPLTGLTGISLELVPDQDSEFAEIDFDRAIATAPSHVVTSITESTRRIMQGLAPETRPEEPLRIHGDHDPESLEAGDVLTASTVTWRQITGGPARWCGVVPLGDPALVLLQPEVWLQSDGPLQLSTWEPETQSPGEVVKQLCEASAALLTARVPQLEQAADAAFASQLDRREFGDFQAKRSSTTRIRHSMELRTKPSETQEPGETPLAAACRLLASDIGVDMREFVPPPDTGDFDENLRRFSEATHLRFREVRLMDGWWKKEEGPLLGVMKDTGDPVALRQKFRRRYLASIARSDGSISTARVRKSLAAQIDTRVWVPYRPLPETPLSFLGVAWFTMRGIWVELILIIVMAIAAALLAVTIPLATALLVDEIIPISDRLGLYTLLGALCAVGVTTAMLKMVAGFFLLRMRAKGSYQLMSAVVGRALAVPSRFASQYVAGDLAQRIDGVERIRRKLMKAILQIIGSSMMIVSFSAVILWYGIDYLALALVLLIPPLVVLAVICWINLKLNRTIQETSGRMQGLSLEILSGIERIRQARAESRIFRLWTGVFSENIQARYRMGISSMVYTVTRLTYPILTTLVLYLVFSIEIFGLPALSDEGTLMAIRDQQPMAQAAPATPSGGGAPSKTPVFSTGEFLAFMSAFAGLLSAALAIGGSLLPLLVLKPVFDRLTPLLHQMPETSVRRSPPGILSGRVELKGVAFRYLSGERPVLRGISFSVDPGEFVAIVGGSGSGKSTIIRMLVGLEQPDHGNVNFDGRSLADLDLTAVRRQIGTVLQDARIVPGSILENIIGGTVCDEADAWRAAKAAAIADEIQELPMKMQTQVASGVISGGQMKQLLIARALVSRPKLIVMDEATSSLDDVSQAKVSESLARLDITRIVVAHRLSSIGGAGRILVVDQGEIVQQGTYDELLSAAGPFRDLVRRQIL